MKDWQFNLVCITATLMIIATAFLVIGVDKAKGATLDTWSGAGPNACYDRCSMEWAIGELTQDERDALLVAMEATNGEAQPYLVQDGDVFDLMTYHDGEGPVAYRTYTVAVLNGMEAAQGWDIGNGRWFVKLEACDNWAIVRRGGAQTRGMSFGFQDSRDGIVPNSSLVFETGLPGSPGTTLAQIVVGYGSVNNVATTRASSESSFFQTTDVTVITTDNNEVSVTAELQPEVDIAPVPIPASAPFLLLALSCLVAAGGRKENL